MKIAILIDDPNSWFVPYGRQLLERIKQLGHDAVMIHDSSLSVGGDICFMLSCSKLVKQKFLEQFLHCIVVHGSDLPAGKGFSPLQWQIMQGKNEITLTLFEAVEDVDAGPYYYKDIISFEGHELLPELRDIMAKKINEMCKSFILTYSELKPKEQEGEESVYRRFNKDDDRIDIDDTIQNQFNHLRIADNDKFPLWFSYMGNEYIIKIEKRKDNQ